VRWSPSGNAYALVSYSTISVYTIDGKVLYKYDQPRYEHILCLVFLKEDVIASGGEDRKITVWNTKSGEVLHTIQGFNNRLKGLDVASKRDNPGPNYDKFLVSISSDQYIRVWDLDHSTEEPIAQLYLEARLTCLTVADNENYNANNDENNENAEIENNEDNNENAENENNEDNNENVENENNEDNNENAENENNDDNNENVDNDDNENNDDNNANADNENNDDNNDNADNDNNDDNNDNADNEENGYNDANENNDENSE